MNGKTEIVNPHLEKFKWLMVWLLVAVGVAGNIFFPLQSVALRITAILVWALIVIAIASFTIKGKAAWLFVRDARIELRKVIWPTRKETIQATFIVVMVVIFTALLLWGLDSLLLFIVGLITGQRG